MIEFLYTGAYKDPDPSTCLLHHAQTYVLADKYSIPRLKGFASSKLSDKITSAQIVDEKDLAAATKYGFENMLSNDKQLRGILLDAIVRNMNIYLEDEDSPLCSLMVEIGELGRDVARAAVSYRSYACRSCDSLWTFNAKYPRGYWDTNPDCPKCSYT